DEAEGLFLAGAEQLRSVGDRDLLPHLLAGAAEAALNRGDMPVASMRAGLALEAAGGSADRTAQLAAERVAGRVTSAAGDGTQARAHFERALELASAIGSPTTMSRVAFDYAQVLEDQGDPTHALNLYRQAYQARQAAARG